MLRFPDPFNQNLTQLATQYGSRLFMAGLLTVGGYWLIKLVLNAIGRVFNRQKVDRDIQPFLISLLKIGLQIALVLSVLSTLGVETTSFIAVIGTAGLAVGLALQGSLANFAGGLLILAFKPFRVGDLIAVQTFTGYVEVVHLLNTILVTTDNRTITIPNNVLTTSPITNYSRMGTIRIDSQVVVDRSYSVPQIRTLIQDAVATCPQALPDRKADVLVNKLTDSGIQLDVRVWCKIDHIGQTNYAVQEAIAGAFAREGIEGPRNEINVLRFKTE
ncbi:mechanosensitive ion channel [Rudanella paleaurantiibacter]|uniref:Mechanosensitive ion channel n=1 Tax=Rudanella paleaurantiibacter TaxID=2614655 RepID=A0A7J5U6E8_9BACT|nr:mechanosensitive ion channel family protein [Rudanella paleaurantiibacter]KAB7733231.1 mechanosensitive ion channel [Rudanella paleaurantiibacter]